MAEHVSTDGILRRGGQARLRHLVEELDDFRDDARIDHGAALRDRADGLAELRHGDALQEIAAGTVLERVEDVLVIVERRQDDDAHLRPALLDGARCLDAVELRHAHIHEHDVGQALPVLLDELDELAAVAGEAGDFHVGIGIQHDAETLADELLVICNHDLDLVHHKKLDASSFSGTMASSVKPESLQ